MNTTIQAWEKIIFVEDKVGLEAVCAVHAERECGTLLCNSQQPIKLVFVYLRYGNNLCLLDATYRTTKYALPLFFVAVKTNLGYSEVGESVVQYETAEAIQTGLETIKTWMKEDNKVWNPSYFMTNFSEREMKAIEETLTGKFKCRGTTTIELACAMA